MSDLFTASDGILAERSADGDTAAFSVLVRRHAPFLRAFAQRLTGSAADADDAVQEALISAWRQLPTLQDPAKVRSWMTSIVSRKATDRIRSRRPLGELDDDLVADHGSGPEQRAIATSRMEALTRILDDLPEGQRQCWVLKEVGDTPDDEIAERLDLTVTTVRGKLARARQTVVKEMEVWR